MGDIIITPIFGVDLRYTNASALDKPAFKEDGRHMFSADYSTKADDFNIGIFGGAKFGMNKLFLDTSIYLGYSKQHRDEFFNLLDSEGAIDSTLAVTASNYDSFAYGLKLALGYEITDTITANLYVEIRHTSGNGQSEDNFIYGTDCNFFGDIDSSISSTRIDVGLGVGFFKGLFELYGGASWTPFGETRSDKSSPLNCFTETYYYETGLSLGLRSNLMNLF